MDERRAAALRQAFADAGITNGQPARRVTLRRLEAAIDTLGDLTTEDHDELEDSGVRDEISHVIDVLDRIAERRRP